MISIVTNVVTCTDDLIEVVAQIGRRRLPDPYERDIRACTRRFLKNLALAAEEGFDGREARAFGRVKWVARECVPQDYAEVTGIVLDLGFGQTPVGGAFIEACQRARERLVAETEVISELLFEAISRGQPPESATCRSLARRS